MITLNGQNTNGTLDSQSFQSKELVMTQSEYLELGIWAWENSEMQRTVSFDFIFYDLMGWK